MRNVRKLKLEELGRDDIDSFKKKAKLPICIVVDNFRSGLNVGSIFRTSDAFLIERVYLCGITSTPPHKEILKTAIGANHSVHWLYKASTTEAIDELVAAEYKIIGIEQTDASVPLSEYTILPTEKYGIVMGNEVEGISETCLSKIDDFIEIPQHGTKHSLNVSVCAGIVMYKFSQALSNV